MADCATLHVKPGEVSILNGSLVFSPDNPREGDSVHWGFKINSNRNSTVSADVALKELDTTSCPADCKSASGKVISTVRVNNVSPGSNTLRPSNNSNTFPAPASDKAYCVYITNIM